MEFQEAERRFASLQQQFVAVAMGAAALNARRLQLMVQDDEGHWWAKSPDNDEWNYYDGSAWVPGTPPGRRDDFQEAERRYAELKHQFEAGTMGAAEFNAQRQQLMIQDDEGHWWAKSPDNDEWNYYDGSAWVPGTPPGRRDDFQEAERRYAELKHQFEAGTMGAAEFNAQRQQLMIQDDEGHWWAKSPDNDEWNYYDGSAWVSGTPPGYQEEVPSEPTNSPVQTLSPPRPKGAENGENGRRKAPSWMLVAGLIGMAVLAGIVIGATMDREESKPGTSATGDGKESKPAPGYSLIKDDSGTLSVEVPTEWRERITSKSEGEKGGDWASYSGEDAISLKAVNDLNSWRTGTRGQEGVYMAASKRLAQSYTEDELITLGPNNYSSSCEADTPEDFNRPPYSGRMQLWENCGGDSDYNTLTLAAASEGRECVVVLQTGGYLQP